MTNSRVLAGMVIAVALGGGVSFAANPPSATTLPTSNPTTGKSSSVGSATQPSTFTNGLIGVWRIDIEKSMTQITEIPEETQRHAPHETLDEFKTSLKRTLEELVIEVRPNGTATMWTKLGAKRDMVWEKQEEKYWVGTRGGYFSFSIGNIFIISADNRTALCKWQLGYSEGVAPRVPLALIKVRE